jgi:hypothetical protein
MASSQFARSSVWLGLDSISLIINGKELKSRWMIPFWIIPTFEHGHRAMYIGGVHEFSRNAALWQ